MIIGIQSFHDEILQFLGRKHPFTDKAFLLLRLDGRREFHEITKREAYDGYLVYQGGVPEVEEFVKKVKKWKFTICGLRYQKS